MCTDGPNLGGINTTTRVRKGEFTIKQTDQSKPVQIGWFSTGYCGAGTISTGGGIVVYSAVYGAGSRTMDAKFIIQDIASKGLKSFRVNYQTFKADPAPGSNKTLIVKYLKDGKTVEKKIQESQTFEF